MEKANRIFFAPIPEINELELFIVKLKPQNDFSAEYNTQIRTTKQLIHRNKQIIASPVSGQFLHINVIASKTYVKDGCLAECAANLDLFMSRSPGPLTAHIYNNCINYTLSCRLTPDWNRVGKYYARDFAFLTSSRPFDGLSLETHITGGCLTLAVKAYECLSKVTSLDDFGIDMKILEDKEMVKVHRGIHVLPYFSCGTVESITKDLPMSCPFVSYTDIQIYWRDMHGYHLPPYSEDTAYAQVLFNPSGVVYTYPLTCIRLYDIAQRQHGRPSPVINEFLQVVMRQCPFICNTNAEMNAMEESLYGILPSLSVPDPDTYKASPNSEHRLVPREEKRQERRYIPIFTSKSKSIDRTVPTPTDRSRDAGMEKLERKKRRREDSAVDIRAMAQTRSLRSVTISQLLSFCRDNKIRVKSREKKEVLISKIYHFYGLSSNVLS